MQAYDVLLVDDDPFILKGIGKDLASEGYRVTTGESGEKAIELLDQADFDLLITDLVMGRVDGIEVLRRAKEVNPETMTIILTGFGDMASAIEALRLGADDYILKPCESEEMHFRVSKCLEKLELHRKIKIYEHILPVCCVCKKIRNDSSRKPGAGKWIEMEKYLTDKARVRVTSTYCPECAADFSGGLGVDIDSDHVDLTDFPK